VEAPSSWLLFPSPSNIGSFSDGLSYQCPIDWKKLKLSNIYQYLAVYGDVYLKVPSYDGAEYHSHHFFLENERAANGNLYWTEDIHPIRHPLEIERSHNLDAALASFPELQQRPSPPIEKTCYSTFEIPESLDHVRLLQHYLLIHKLQFQRIKSTGTVSVPKSHFGFLKVPAILHDPTIKASRLFRRRSDMPSNISPAIVQQKVVGTDLWSMYKPGIGILSRWLMHLPNISKTLREILRSEHFDWNPKNFIYDEQSGLLYYIDSKPTIFASREINDQNRAGLEKYFVV
jgi:hypothetical protein